MPVEVDDPTDPRLADYVGLTDAELRRRVEGGLFIAEGELVVRALLRSSYPIRSLLATRERLAALGPVLDGFPIYVASRAVMREVVGFDIHRGMVASASRLPLPDVASLLVGARRIAVLEGLNDHENLGALFRNAAALGVDAVLLDPTCADPLYRRAVRVSLGHVLHVPFTRVAPWPAALGTVVDAGFDLVALTPRPSAEPVETLDGVSGRVAFLIGGEGHGLSGAALDMASRWVRIPMADGVDSLNVATAAAIAFHRAGPG